MPRRRRRRWVEEIPTVSSFVPEDTTPSSLVVLTVDEFEAIRLKDLLGLEQEEAAGRMGISQPTFHRLLLSARRKIADAIVNAKAIKIKGGEYKMVGRGRMGGYGLGPGGDCVCPNCGYKQTHARGQPCYEMTCPKCGAKMTRA